MHSYHIVEEGLPLNKAKKALILLHGRGGTAQNILTLAPELQAKDFYIAAPQATENRWYPYSFMEEEARNEPWLSSAVETVKRLIDATANHIEKSHIYILGFSQGACLALETSARYADKYGGIIAFTGGLIGKTLDKNKYQGTFQGTKIFIGTSDDDPYIPLSRAKESRDMLAKLGADVTLKVYAGMDHTINEDEIEWVKSHVTLI